MTVEAVTKSTLFSKPRDNIISIINGSIKDPLTNSKNSTRKWIYSFEPDTKGRSFKGYPYMVVEYPSNEENDKTFVGLKDNINTMTITVVVLKENSSQGSSLMNELYEAFNNQTNQDNLQDNGLMDNLTITTDRPREVIDNEQSTVQQTMTIEHDIDLVVE